jgi:hypothetical protein
MEWAPYQKVKIVIILAFWQNFCNNMGKCQMSKLKAQINTKLQNSNWNLGNVAGLMVPCFLTPRHFGPTIRFK